MVMRGGGSDGKKIRKTNESPPRVSVYDLINVVLSTGRGRNILFFETENANREVGMQPANLFKFPGAGQKPTPVVDARGAVTIINLLPGRTAAAFRAKFMDIVARYLGGDATLIAEINHNAMIQAALPVDHPMAIFGQDVAAVNAHAVFVTPTERSIVPCTYLEEEIDVADISVPSLVIAPNCLYAIRIGYYRASKKTILKFGMTDDINERMKAHRKTFKHMKGVFIISLGEYATKPAEDTIKYFSKVRSRMVEVSVGDTNQRECFACDSVDVDTVIESVMDEIKRHHGPKIMAVCYKGKNETYVQGGVVSKCSGSTLEIEKEKTKQSMSLVQVEQEKTKQAKANTIACVELAKIELEKMRIQLQIAQLNAGR